MIQPCHGSMYIQSVLTHYSFCTVYSKTVHSSPKYRINHVVYHLMNDKMCCIYTVGYYSAIKNEIFSFAAEWLELDIII